MTGIKTSLMIALLTVCGVASSAGPDLFAQATSPANGSDSSSSIETIGERIVTKAITALGPLAILGWFLWHASTKMLPAKDAQLVAERAAYQAEAAAERAAHAAVVDKIVSELKDERNAVLQVVKSCEARRGG